LGVSSRSKFFLQKKCLVTDRFVVKKLGSIFCGGKQKQGKQGLRQTDTGAIINKWGDSSAIINMWVDSSASAFSLSLWTFLRSSKPILYSGQPAKPYSYCA